MSLMIDHSTRGVIKIKTFDSETLEQEKKRMSLTKIIAIVRDSMRQIEQKELDSCTDQEIAFLEIARDWCNVADFFALDGCDPKELLQVAKIGKQVGGFFSLTVAPESPACWIEQLAVTPPNLSSGIGSILIAAACREGQRRNHTELCLSSLKSAVGFYQALGMRKVKTDQLNYPVFSLNLLEPLPPRLKKIASKIHSAKRDLKNVSSEEAKEPSLKRRCTKAIPEEAPKM